MHGWVTSKICSRDGRRSPNYLHPTLDKVTLSRHFFSPFLSLSVSLTYSLSHLHSELLGRVCERFSLPPAPLQAAVLWSSCRWSGTVPVALDHCSVTADLITWARCLRWPSWLASTCLLLILCYVLLFCLALYVTLYFNISQAHLSRNYEKTVDNRGINVYSRQHPQSSQHRDTM